MRGRLICQPTIVKCGCPQNPSAAGALARPWPLRHSSKAAFSGLGAHCVEDGVPVAGVGHLLEARFAIPAIRPRIIRAKYAWPRFRHRAISARLSSLEASVFSQQDGLHHRLLDLLVQADHGRRQGARSIGGTVVRDRYAIKCPHSSVDRSPGNGSPSRTGRAARIRSRSSPLYPTKSIDPSSFPAGWSNAAAPARSNAANVALGVFIGSPSAAGAATAVASRIIHLRHPVQDDGCVDQGLAPRDPHRTSAPLAVHVEPHVRSRLV